MPDMRIALVVPGLLRWRLVVARARLRARIGGNSLVVRSGAGVRAGRGVRIEVRGGPCVLEVGDGSRLHDQVTIDLSGGNVLLGPRVELRARVVLRAADGATLRMDGTNMLSYGAIVHASASVHLGERAAVAEYTTIIDSAHVPASQADNFRDSLVTAPVTIGPNAWIAAKATITAGVNVGAGAVVAANAVVVRDVDPGAVVGGIPARVIRPAATDDHLR